MKNVYQRCQIYKTVISVNNNCGTLCTHLFKNKFTRKNVLMQIKIVNNTYVLSKWLIIIVSNCVDAFDTLDHLYSRRNVENQCSPYNQILVLKDVQRNLHHFFGYDCAVLGLLLLVSQLDFSVITI